MLHMLTLHAVLHYPRRHHVVFIRSRIGVIYYYIFDGLVTTKYASYLPNIMNVNKSLFVAVDTKYLHTRRHSALEENL